MTVQTKYLIIEGVGAGTLFLSSIHESGILLGIGIFIFLHGMIGEILTNVTIQKVNQFNVKEVISGEDINS